MRHLCLSEIKSVTGAKIAVTLQPGTTCVELSEKSDTYSISFFKSVGFFVSDYGILTLHGNGTYSWGTNFWGTPNPDYLPVEINTENSSVAFTIKN